ncbi:MAG TPA: diguanylate cyclase [Micromonosporaceae bacterium]
MHLLEKEPDNRYQTADGLIHDLELVRDGVPLVRVGERDVPLRLTDPSHLVGRDREISALTAAFEGVRAGGCRGVVVSGESGVGKTALLEELRPIATAGHAWFTSGRFDRFRRDQEHDGVGQAFRGLGRLLLAEPEAELAEIRRRLCQALGPNAGLAAAVLPEFASLLQVRPDPGDPLTAQIRAHRTAIELIRAVASRRRPVVFVVDDIQWAGATPLGALELLLSGEEDIEGLLVVTAYRESDVREGHPLAPIVARWRSQPGGPEHLRIRNLDRRDLATMVGEMLHIPHQPATDFADSIFGLTDGNPYETVELLNGLRREGVLRPTASGWSWDPATLEHRLGRELVAELLEARIGGLPAATRQVTEVMACLGGEVQLPTLEVATGLSMSEVQQHLAPALNDGLLVMVSGLQAVRFHHDRLREIVLSDIPDRRARDLRLRMARRLAVRPELAAAAADQYLNVVDDLHDPQERRRAAALLRQAAGQTRWIGESQAAETFLAAAARLTDDPATLIELHTARHSTLFRLGRLAEADEVYETIVPLTSGAYDHVDATRVQISSLTNRNRPEDAIALGLSLLDKLGWAVPQPDQVEYVIESELDWCTRWINETSEATDLSRPSIDDPDLLRAGALISQMMPACFFRDQVTMAWLSLSAARAWADKGPTKTLVGAIGHLPWVLIARRQDFRSSYRLMRRLLAVGDRRGFEPDTSQARFLFALGLCHWFDPVEEEASHGQRAREGLVRGGDLQDACYTFTPALYEIDRASTVDAYATEVDAAIDFARRTGNQHAAGVFQPYRWLVAALRGEPTVDGKTMVDQLAEEPVAAASAHLARALAAAMLDDPQSLDEHSMATMVLRPVIEATYAIWQAHLLRAIALADRARSTRESANDLSEFDEILDWITRRAADMPTNFRHVMYFVQAERARVWGDFRTAIHCFDSALRAAGHRPWHRAYIAERLAKFLLANGLDHIGWTVLVEAREAYRVWGARAKVHQLDRAYPSLELPTEPSGRRATRRASITAGAIDMLAILDAARALSSETSIRALRAKVVEVLSAMTSSTGVNLFVHDGDEGQWHAVIEDEGGRAPLDHQHEAPRSLLRYVERTREPLIVGDATRDDRFDQDPYFRDLDACSVLAVPVLSRGTLRAILLLENRLMSDAFPVERLEVAMLIAGQLAVSLDNALVYASLEDKVAERTQQLAMANERLAQLSVTDPLTGLANRRRLEESLEAEWKRARRSHTPLSLAMVDIDHFKLYNDQHGHREGDRCLQRVAGQLGRNVRDTDVVARYGGEEFAVVMPHTDSASAREVAERIRLAIRDLAEPLTADQVVTASVGVATLHVLERRGTDQVAERRSTDELVERADTALYKAKRAGRNRVRSTDID